MSMARPNHATYPDYMEAEYLLRMPAEMHADVKLRAAAESISMAEWIRRAIQTQIDIDRALQA